MFASKQWLLAFPGLPSMERAQLGRIKEIFEVRTSRKKMAFVT
jgi:hypothetical protein